MYFRYSMYALYRHRIFGISMCLSKWHLVVGIEPRNRYVLSRPPFAILIQLIYRLFTRLLEDKESNFRFTNLKFTYNLQVASNPKTKPDCVNFYLQVIYTFSVT